MVRHSRALIIKRPGRRRTRYGRRSRAPDRAEQQRSSERATTDDVGTSLYLYKRATETRRQRHQRSYTRARTTHTKAVCRVSRRLRLRRTLTAAAALGSLRSPYGEMSRGPPPLPPYVCVRPIVYIIIYGSRTMARV